jgi:hypothetical protein
MNGQHSSELFQFFAAYFHEDWSVDAASPDDVIDSFIAAHTGSECAHIASLIDAFAAAVLDDQALERALFAELGCYYVPTADAQSTRGWLQRVSGRLRAVS